MPKRIQLKRAKGWRKPAGAVVVARPSRWGNPFRMVDRPAARSACSYAWAAGMFQRWIEGRLVVESPLEDPGPAPSHDTIRRDLGGRDLACWCPPDKPCHADVLLEIANRPPGEAT